MADAPASASQVLGSEVSATVPGCFLSSYVSEAGVTVNGGLVAPANSQYRILGLEHSLPCLGFKGEKLEGEIVRKRSR